MSYKPLRLQGKMCILGIVTTMCACSSQAAITVTQQPPTVTSSVEKAGFDRAYVDGVYAADPGIHLPLPTRLPAGYRFLGFSSSAFVSIPTAGSDRKVISRSALFDGPDGLVNICAEIIAQPGTICPESNVDIEQEESGIRRTVFIQSRPDRAVALWGSVTYSDDPGEWTWL